MCAPHPCAAAPWALTLAMYPQHHQSQPTLHGSTPIHSYISLISKWFVRSNSEYYSRTDGKEDLHRVNTCGTTAISRYTETRNEQSTTVNTDLCRNTYSNQHFDLRNASMAPKLFKRLICDNGRTGVQSNYFLVICTIRFG